MGTCYGSNPGIEELINETKKPAHLYTFDNPVNHLYTQTKMGNKKFFEYDLKFNLPANSLSWMLFEANDSTNVINCLDKTFSIGSVLPSQYEEKNGNLNYIIKIESEMHELTDEILLKSKACEEPSQTENGKDFVIEQWTLSKKQMKNLLREGVDISGKMSGHFDRFAGTLKVKSVNDAELSIEVKYKVKEHHINITALEEAPGKRDSPEHYQNRFFVFLNKKIEGFVDFVLKVHEKEFDVRDLYWLDGKLDGIQEAIDRDAQRFKDLYAQGKLHVSENLAQRLS